MVEQVGHLVGRLVLRSLVHRQRRRRLVHLLRRGQSRGRGRGVRGGEEGRVEGGRGEEVGQLRPGTSHRLPCAGRGEQGLNTEESGRMGFCLKEQEVHLSGGSRTTKMRLCLIYLLYFQRELQSSATLPGRSVACQHDEKDEEAPRPTDQDVGGDAVQASGATEEAAPARPSAPTLPALASVEEGSLHPDMSSVEGSRLIRGERSG